MKKTLLSLSLLSICGSAAASELYNGRISGMSGAGYVTSNYSDGVLLNSSMGAAHNTDDRFALVLNAGGVASDKDDLIDAMEDLVDYTDYLDEISNPDDISNAQDFEPGMADILTGYLEKVEGKTVNALAGTSLVVSIPNEMVSVSLIAKASGSVSVFTYVDPADYVLIDTAATANQPFDTSDLQSSVTGRGAIIQEVGVSFAKAVVDTDSKKILVGITPKRVTVETLIYTATVDNYDEDDIDSDENKKESSATSFDAGITYIEGNIRYGLAVTDAVSKDFETITAEKFELKTKTTAAVGYSKGWLTAEAALDLNATPVFGLDGEVKMLRAGVELSPYSFLHISAGMARDLEDTLEDTYSFGIGTYGINLAVFTGKNNTTGGALQLGMRF